MGVIHHSAYNLHVGYHSFFIGFPSTCFGITHMCRMDLLNISRKVRTSGSVVVLLPVDLIVKGDDTFDQCQCPQSIPLNF